MSGSANTPILKINVDTAEFDKFKSDLDEVIKAVKAPLTISISSNSNTLSIFGDMRDILIDIKDILKKIGQEFIETTDVINDNLNTINSNVHDFGNKVNTNVARATDSFKLLGGQLNHINLSAKGFTLEVAKWAGIGGVVAGLFEGLGYVFTLSNKVSSERTTSLGLGTSIGGLKSFDLNYNRFGLGDETLQKMAEAKRNPGGEEALALYALKFSQQQIASMSPEELASQSYERAVQELKKSGGNTLGLSALGVTKLFSPNSLTAGLNAGDEERAQVRQNFLKGQKDFAVPPDTAKQWADFKTALDRASQQIETVFVKGLIHLTPLLNNFAEALPQFIKDISRPSFFQESIDSLKQMGTDIKKMVVDFTTNFTDFYKWIKDSFKDLIRNFLSLFFNRDKNPSNPKDDNSSLLPGFSNQSYHAYGGFDPGLVRRASYSPGAAYGNGETQQIPAGGYGDIDATTGARAQAIAQQLMEAGYTREQAAGVVGNLLRETSTLDPDESGDNGHAHGIAQWNDLTSPDRLAEFRRWAGHDINDPHGMTKAQRIHEQTAFMIHELKTSEKRAGQHLHQARNEREAAAVINKEYERSADSNEGRANSASNVLKRYLRDVDIANRDQNQASPTSSTTTINRNTTSTQAVNIKVQNQTGGSAIASMSQISVPV